MFFVFVEYIHIAYIGKVLTPYATLWKMYKP